MEQTFAAKKPVEKIRAARQSVDFVIDELVAAYPGDEGAGPNVDVAVIGYQAAPGGGLDVVPLLPGATREQPWVAAANLLGATVESRPNGPRRWVSAVPVGEMPEGGVIGYAYDLVQRWRATHPATWRPLVIHCTDRPAWGGVDALALRSFPLLATRAGTALLYTCGFSEAYSGFLFPGEDDPALPEDWQRLREISAPLPGTDGPGSAAPSRALSINVVPRRLLRELIQGLGRVEPAPEPADAAGDSTVVGQVTELWDVKYGNEESQWEDGFVHDTSRGMVAVGDGAGEGIFVKRWVEILGQEFFDRQPNLDERASLAEWLEACRRRWLERINYSSLGWPKKPKVDRVGGAATFLAFRLEPAREQPAGQDAVLLWKAWAVGDTCLFHIRDNQLRASFPIVRSCDFGIGPYLLRTKEDEPIPVPLAARGSWRPGDVFAFATDAVAEWLLRTLEQGTAVDWERYRMMDRAAWQAEIAAVRAESRIVNDDCTLLFLRPGVASDPGPEDQLQGR